jgi:hypothetical protein
MSTTAPATILPFAGAQIWIDREWQHEPAQAGGVSIEHEDVIVYGWRANGQPLTAADALTTLGEDDTRDHDRLVAALTAAYPGATIDTPGPWFDPRDQDPIVRVALAHTRGGSTALSSRPDE